MSFHVLLQLHLICKFLFALSTCRSLGALRCRKTLFGRCWKCHGMVFAVSVVKDLLLSSFTGLIFFFLSFFADETPMGAMMFYVGCSVVNPH